MWRRLALVRAMRVAAATRRLRSKARIAAAVHTRGNRYSRRANALQRLVQRQSRALARAERRIGRVKAAARLQAFAAVRQHNRAARIARPKIARLFR